MLKRIIASAAGIAAGTAIALGGATAASAAVASPPPVGPAVYGNVAGYTATARDFRFVAATITVPAQAWCSPSHSPAFYISLGSADNTAVAGIGCLGGTWEAFAARSVTGIYGPHTIWNVLPGVDPGDGVFFSIYYNATGNELHFTFTPPSYPSVSFGVRADGAVYTSATAGDAWFGALPHQPANTKTVNQFYEGRFTTLSGVQGTFDGPWTLSEDAITSNGYAPPLGTLLAAPGPVGTDGLGIGAGDHFTVYRVGSN